VFLRLRESARKTERRVLRMSVVSLGIHSALVLGGVSILKRASRSAAIVQVDTAMVYLASPVAEPTVPLDMPLQGVPQSLVAPTQIPSSIPTIDLQEHFDPRTYSGTGTGTETAATDDQIYTTGGVEEAPALLSPPPAYPELLRRAGIQGHVLLQAVVDTTGRVEPNSVKILKSSSPGFDLPTKRWALDARFRPARLQGRAVRVLVNLPVDFSTSDPVAGGRGGTS
jgi:protein TonB